MREDPAQVQRVTCRVHDDKFNNYVVLEKLEWGYAPHERPESFRAAVRIVFRGTPLELQLNEDFRLMTFLTKDGYIPPNVHLLWPLESRHDRSFVHVFAYDLQRASKTATPSITPLKTPDHPQRAQIDAMITRCEELDTVSTSDERDAFDFLCQDNLWDTSFSSAPATYEVRERLSYNNPHGAFDL